MTEHRIIPRHEPEVIAAGAHHSLIVDGVVLESRYGKAHELELMRQLILDLPPTLRHAVTRIYCDSDWFHVVLRDCEDGASIGERIAASALAHNGGHNSIWLTALDPDDPDSALGNPDEFQIEIGPDWNNDVIPFDESLEFEEPNWRPAAKKAHARRIQRRLPF
jgi:hypothetical protein